MPLQLLAIRSPLGIIALFVALIELFLAYPVTQLQGPDRTLIVYFMVFFPFFVASVFFIVLIFRPLNLYNPSELTPNLQERFPTAVIAENKAWEIKVRELQNYISSLEGRTTQSERTLTEMVTKSGLTQRAEKALTSEIASLTEEIRARLPPASPLDTSSLERAKDDVVKARLRSREQRTEAVLEQHLRMKQWLVTRGFSNIPELQ